MSFHFYSIMDIHKHLLNEDNTYIECPSNALAFEDVESKLQHLPEYSYTQTVGSNH